MTRQRFVDRQSARAACAVPFLGTRPVRPVGRDPFPLSSCRARRADRGWPSATREVPVHRPRAPRSASTAHTRSCIFYSSNTLRGSPLDASTVNATWATPPGFQREPAVTSPVRIKSQESSVSSLSMAVQHASMGEWRRTGEKLEESRDALERALCGRGGGRSRIRSLPVRPQVAAPAPGDLSVGSRPGWDSTPATGEAEGGDATGPSMAPVGGGTRTADTTRPESVCREVRSLEAAGDRRSVDGQAAATSGGRREHQ